MPRVKKVPTQQAVDPLSVPSPDNTEPVVEDSGVGQLVVTKKEKKPRKPRAPKKKASEEVSGNSSEISEKSSEKVAGGDVLKPEGVKKKRAPSAWNLFFQKKRKEDKTLTIPQISAMYKESKAQA